jgi:hypothetical protein
MADRGVDEVAMGYGWITVSPSLGLPSGGVNHYGMAPG